jgi:photosystem II stability/assembly factor-like uncharacterized protein
LVRSRTRKLLIIASLVLLAPLLFGLSRPTIAEGAQGSWSQLDLDNLQINVVIANPNNSSILLAGTNGQGIFRSADGGQNWAQVNSGLGNLFINDLLIDPTNTNNILAAVGRGSLVGEPGGGVYRSTDGGSTWNLVQEAGTIWSLALTPQNPSVIYAAGGPPVFKSTDGGATWAPAFVPGTELVNIEARGVTVNPADANIVLLAGNTEGGQGQVFRSTNAGASWDRVLVDQAAILDISFVQDLRAGVLAFFGNLVGVFRSSDTGLTWQRVTGNLGDITVLDVEPDPLDGNEVAAATESGVIRSTDAGATFSQLDTTLGNQSVRGVAYDRASPQTIYAGTDDGVWAFTFAQPPGPPPFTPVATYFFAEGSTQQPFDTWFLVQNPTANGANVRFTFQLEGGGSQVRDFTVGPNTRFSLFVNQILPNVAFSTRVEADQQVFVERSLFVGFDGSVITGIPSPENSWLFAEGATVQPFDTWVLIQNPNAVPANTTVTYLLRDRAPVVQSLGALPPTSRTSIFVNQVLPNEEFGIRVDSDQPVIAERSTFRFPGNAATSTAGATAASRSWFFAEGNSIQQPLPWDTFLLLSNPQQTSTTVTIVLFNTAGQQTSLQIAMPPNSRRTIFLNDIFPNTSFGFRVDSSEPIVAERSQFFGPEPRGATASQGATSLATEWNLAEGSTQPPFSTNIAILNPNSAAMNARIDFQLENGQVVTRDFLVNPTSKLSVDVGSFLPNNAFSAKVTTSLPSVVERTMFLNKLGSIGVTNAVGVPR